MPERCWRKLSATRSALRIARAFAAIVATRAPFKSAPPSAISHSTFAAGSRSRNASAATSVPARTPSCFASMWARPAAPSSTTASVVASPPPRSSVSARRTRGKAIASRRMAGFLSRREADFVQPVPEDRRHLEVLTGRGGEHFPLQQLHECILIEIERGARQDLLRGDRGGRVGHRGGAHDPFDRLEDRLGRDAVLGVVAELGVAPPVHLLDGPPHRSRHLVGV